MIPILETHAPAGASVMQLLYVYESLFVFAILRNDLFRNINVFVLFVYIFQSHYGQLIRSHRFCQYDHGAQRNQELCKENIMKFLFSAYSILSFLCQMVVEHRRRTI